MSKGLDKTRPFYFFNMNIDFLYSKFLELKKISTDTRKETKGSIFFCLKGSNFNGNNYALDAIKKGAEIVVVDEKIRKKDPKLYYVNNVLNCLQIHMNHHFLINLISKFSCDFIGSWINLLILEILFFITHEIIGLNILYFKT